MDRDGDFAVVASIPVISPWKPGEVPKAPVVLSFQQLLAKSPNENLAKVHPPGPKRPAEAMEGLEQIGKRDPLHEVIRSMENRLARQGILAAPETIIKKKRHKAGMFYDVSDNFIDDQELETLNTLEERKSKGADATGTSSVPEEPLQPTVAAEGFRLTTAEVSGTSESSGSDVEALAAETAWKRLPGRGWAYQLAELEKEMVLVSVPGAAPPEMTAEESLMSIKQLLEDFCGRLNPSELPVAANKDLERGLREVRQRLPGLLRVKADTEVPDSLPLDHLTGKGPASCSTKRWSLHGLEPRSKRADMERGLQTRFKRMGGPAAELWKGSGQRAAGEGDDDPFPWTETEEVAWCCFCWRLVSSMNEQLKRGRFLRSWLAASQESQRVHFEQAQELLRGRLVPNKGAGGVAHKGTLVALLPHIRALQRMWLRKALWQEQRQAERVQVDFPGKLCDAVAPKEGFKQLRAMALFVTEKLKEVGIHFPQESLARKDPVWKKGQWISQRVDGIIRNGLITGAKVDLHYEIQWGDGSVANLPEKQLKPLHLWRRGEAVEIYDETGSFRRAVVLENFEKVAKVKELGQAPVTVSCESGTITVQFQHVQGRKKSDLDKVPEVRMVDDVIEVG